MSADHADTLLVVEDNESTRELLADYFNAIGYRVETAADGGEALRKIRSVELDLVLLDLMIPHVDGLTLCGVIRRETGLPVVMVTARTSEDDRVTGLDAGADDYVPKPFSLRELAARVRAVLRRSRQERGPALLEIGDLVLDRSSRSVRRDGRSLSLTRREFDLLACLMGSPGRVYSREELVERTMGPDYEGQLRTVDMHVTNLRRKLGDTPDGRPRIRTVYGSGYAFEGGAE